jgi:integrase
VAGSVRQIRPGVWELRIYLGRDDTGRVRHRHATLKGTRRAAERELARLVADQEREPERPSNEEEQAWGPTTTINDAVEGWRMNGWQDLSPNTVRGYDGVWRRHVKDSIGTRRIATLSPYDVERYFRDLKAAGAGATTVRLVRALLRRSCRLARKWSGNRLPNPITDTELPTWSAAERPQPVRSPESSEVLAILEAARYFDRRVAVLIRLVAATGMRRGEACALRWADIDEQAGSVTIDEGIVSTAAGAVARSPKTRSSRRRVAVDDITLAQLAELHRHQEEVSRSCEIELEAESFVFSYDAGGRTPPNPDNISHAFADVRDAAGVAADVHLHSLRHFHATALDPVISEAQKQSRLGWATVHMARHYTDGLPAEDRRAAEHIGRLLSPETQTG